jgi:hypothetical protein
MNGFRDRTTGLAGRTAGTISYRPPQPDELMDCALIWHEAVDDYMTKLGRPLPPPVVEPALKLSSHLLETDPDLFRVAVRSRATQRDQIVAFGIAIQRERVWFLSQLYVLPSEQGHGLGRGLLTRILPRPPDGEPPADSGAPGVLATCADTLQPVSNALYAGLGIVPRVPVFNLVGRPRDPRTLPQLPEGVVAVPLEPPELVAHRNPAGPADAQLGPIVDDIDRAVLGYAHPADHRFLRVQGRTGFLYRGPDGEPLGYGYSSHVGRFGPVALLDETLTAPVIGHLLRTVEPRGAATAWVPGSNDRAMVAFLRAGLRLEGFPAMLCWSRPFGRFDSYLPAGLALL